MNLFRSWGRDPRFRPAFDTLSGNFTHSFVEFCEDYIIGWGSIDFETVPHPWDALDEEGIRVPNGRFVRGIFLDGGNAPTSV